MGSSWMWMTKLLLLARKSHLIPSWRMVTTQWDSLKVDSSCKSENYIGDLNISREVMRFILIYWFYWSVQGSDRGYDVFMIISDEQWPRDVQLRQCGIWSLLEDNTKVSWKSWWLVIYCIDIELLRRTWIHMSSCGRRVWLGVSGSMRNKFPS